MQQGHDIGAKNVTQRNPREKSKRSFQGCGDERFDLGFFKHLGAELKNLGEFLAELILQSRGFMSCHFLGREVKNFLAILY